MGLFDLLMVRPNLGQPVLVNRSDNGFNTYFAGIDDKLDPKSILDSRLYLQSLSDTRKVLDSPDNIKNFQSWPNELRDKLIELNIDNVIVPVKFSWSGISTPNKIPSIESNEYKFEYKVVLKADKLNVGVPQLFNIIQVSSDNQLYNMNFHSVYLHNRDWHNFSFIHASDSHIAWRNDFIPRTIQEQSGKKPAHYINWNSNFRDFIKYVNALHKQGECDYIILTGDIVDYINVEAKFGSFQPDNNFEVFRDIVLGWARYDGSVVGEELEVPIYTMLGNHDYRPAEYPLVAIIEATTDGLNAYPVSEYGNFGLALDEAIAYHKARCTNWDTDDAFKDENGVELRVPTWDADHGLSFQSHLNDPPISYRTLINPDLNYVIPIGIHKIICLDSGFDRGNFGSVLDAFNAKVMGLFKSKSTWDLMNGTPDGNGFSQEQIDFLKFECEYSITIPSGILILAFHHPLINFREKFGDGINIPHLFREVEHVSLNSDSQIELCSYLKHNNQLLSNESQLAMGKIIGFKNDQIIIQIIMPHKFKTKDEYGQIVEDTITGIWMAPKFADDIEYGEAVYIEIGVAVYPLDHYPDNWRRFDSLSDWSLNKTPYFRKGKRDQYENKGDGRDQSYDKVIGLGDGDVPFENDKFEKFMEVIYKNKANLILTGHTHNSVEYMIKQNENGHEYYHDYYIDGELRGLNPKYIFCGRDLPSYNDILNTSTDKALWWNNHRALNVHAPSVGYTSLMKPVADEHIGFQEKVGALKIQVKDDQIARIDRIYQVQAFSLRYVAEARNIAPLTLRQLAKDMALEKDIISMQDLLKGIGIEEFPEVP